MKGRSKICPLGLKRFCLQVLLFCSLPLFAQESFFDVEEIHANVEIPQSLRKSLLQSRDSLGLRLELEAFLSQKQEKGWLEYSLLTFEVQDEDLYLELHEGPRYYFSNIELQGLGASYLNRTNISDWLKKPCPVNWQALEEDLESCLLLYQEEGYPFASFNRESLTYLRSGDSLLTEVSYRFDAGPLIKIDSIEIKGNIREGVNFVSGLIRLRKGDKYQHSRIADIPRILNNSIYYQNARQPKITFTPFKTARIQIDLEQQKSGKFDVLVGFLPNPDPNTDRRLRITGSMDILLVSPLKRGEIIQLKYESLIEGTQNTLVSLKLPYLLRTPVRAEGELRIYQQEEDFLNVNAGFTGIYAFNPFLEGNLFVDRRQSILLGDSAEFSALAQPEQLDGNWTLFGGGLTYRNLDFLLNPSKGWDAKLRVGVGQKSIRENPFAPESWYEGRPQVQPIQQIQVEAHRYFSIFPRNVIHLANRTQWLGAREYFRNDQWQIGGSRILRGFNENQFLTDFFSLSTLEYRFQLEKRSYLLGFVDYAYIRDRVLDQEFFPLGVGVGMNYGTKAGILSITYAVGRTRLSPFRPSSGKIHIGFINQF